MDILQETRVRFAQDIYAVDTTGITIEAVDTNYAKCRLSTDERHFNAAGYVMGGAIFTLADFAMAVASNTNNALTVTLSANIDFMTGTKGPVLYAEAVCKKDGRTVCFFETTVTDSDGAIVARATSSGFRKR